MSFLSALGTTTGFNMLRSLLNPERGYQEGEKAINRSWQEASGYMKPYMQAGMDEYGRLKDATGALLDPQALESKWMEGYETSPYALDELERSKNIGLDAASSMGLLGSTPALESIQRTGTSILNQDRRNYLNDLIQKYLAGIQSSQNIFGTGAGISQSLGQGALGTGENRALLQYGQKNAPGELLARILGMGVGAGGTALTNSAMTGAIA